MLLYTVLRGTEKAAMLADPSLTTKHLIQHCFWVGRGFPSFDMDKKIIFIRNYALINWCSKEFWQRLYIWITLNVFLCGIKEQKAPIQSLDCYGHGTFPSKRPWT